MTYSKNGMKSRHQVS